jgi:hypothetical protein
MAIGRRHSFANIQPVNDPLAGAITFADDAFERKRREDAVKAEKQKKLEEDKLKDYADWDGKFDPKIIGNTSIDDPLIGMAVKAKNRVAEINKELYATNNFEKKAQLMSERNKLLQSFEVANQTPKMILEKVKQIDEGIRQGKYNRRNVEFIKQISQQIESGKYELNYDDRGVANIKIYDTDESGQVKGLLKETSLGDLVNSFEPKLAFKYEDYKDLVTKNVKPFTKATQVGSRIVEQKIVSEENKQQARTFADVIINDPDKLYEVQYLFNEKDPEKLRTKLEEDFIGQIEKSYKQSIDTGFLNYSRGVQKDNEKEAVYGIVETPPELTQAGVVPRQGYKTVSVTNSKPVPKISSFNLVTLDAYTVTTKPDGQRAITAVINYPDVKTSTLAPTEKNIFEMAIKKRDNNESLTQEEELVVQKVTKGAEYKKTVVNLSEKEAFKFAKQLGFSNVNQMKDVAGKDEKNSNSQKPKQSDKKTYQFDAQGNLIE